MQKISERYILDKIKRIKLGLLCLIIIVCCIGIMLLYSAAGGSFEPWAARQIYVSLGFFPIMLLIALVDTKFLYDNAYIIYFLCLALLLVAEILGYIAMGAQRWIRFGGFNLQPSELMKIAIILALARYFQGVHPDSIRQIKYLCIPIILVMLPVLLILKQPNLGTATIILLLSGGIFFAVGVQVWKFLVVIAGVGMLAPVGWRFLHSYQKKRILTFLDPEKDPLGGGYNIIQSKIAIGSGGMWGKGFIKGSQTQLNFLPEKHTDFIFTILAEEFGFVGSFVVIACYAAIIIYSYTIALNCRNQFGRVIAVGVSTMIAVHIFINLAMISGLIPAVGTPLPLLSYGGSNIMTMLIGFGLLFNVNANHKQTGHFR